MNNSIEEYNNYLKVFLSHGMRKTQKLRFVENIYKQLKIINS